MFGAIKSIFIQSPLVFTGGGVVRHPHSGFRCLLRDTRDSQETKHVFQDINDDSLTVCSLSTVYQLCYITANTNSKQVRPGSQAAVPDGNNPGPGALQVFDVGGGDVRGASSKLVSWKVFLRQHTWRRHKTDKKTLRRLRSYKEQETNTSTLMHPNRDQVPTGADLFFLAPFMLPERSLQQTHHNVSQKPQTTCSSCPHDTITGQSFATSCDPA